MNIITEVMSTIKKIDNFAIAVVISGLFLSVGLIIIGYIIYYMEPSSINPLNAIACTEGAFKAAPIIIVESFIGGIICDMAIKDKQNKEE
jgi:hypothetical protein